MRRSLLLLLALAPLVGCGAPPRQMAEPLRPAAAKPKPQPARSRVPFPPQTFEPMALSIQAARHPRPVGAPTA